VTISPPTAARRRIMSAIKGRGNRTTELTLARVLRRERLSGWRRHLPLPGRPDFAWPAARVAVFVDGCFWHGCPRCYRAPAKNKSYWRKKIEENRKRDRRVTSALKRAGWTVLRIWECQVTAETTEVRIREALQIPCA
jgi:DNA mismatch endonuclease (patch repair protein)